MVDEDATELESQRKAPEKTKKSLSLPKEITREWLNKAIETGVFEVSGKEIFIQRFDPEKSATWLIDNCGFSTPGPDGEGYFYHGTSIEDATSIVKNGLFSTPEHPTVSTILENQAKTTARDHESKLKVGAVVVFKTNWKGVEIQGTGFGEPIGYPTSIYTGAREKLPIPQHLKDVPELRWLSPDKAIGMFIVSQKH